MRKTSLDFLFVLFVVAFHAAISVVAVFSLIFHFSEKRGLVDSWTWYVTRLGWFLETPSSAWYGIAFLIALGAMPLLLGAGDASDILRRRNRGWLSFTLRTILIAIASPIFYALAVRLPPPGATRFTGMLDILVGGVSVAMVLAWVIFAIPASLLAHAFVRMGHRWLAGPRS